MRYTMYAFMVVFLLWGSLPVSMTSAQSAVQPAVELDSGSVVCPPGVYPAGQDACVPLGPSEYLARIVAQGIPYPLLPVPAYNPPAALREISFLYFKVNENGAPLYDSLTDASLHISNRSLKAGFLYVSYIGLETAPNGESFFRLRSGSFIGADGARVAVPTFQGLEFSSVPQRAFGWVVDEATPRYAPGANQPVSGRVLRHFEVVQIYDTRQVGSVLWNLVGPDQWVESNHIARVDPHSTKPAGINGDRWIEVNLYEQTVSVYENNRLIFATLASTGIAPFWTRPGLFQIYLKIAASPMTISTANSSEDYYYLEDVPWTMYFDADRALHGAYWHNKYGIPRSHGCVNLSVGDSHWLYDWADVGDYVYVYDPTGQTPVDPVNYGAGAP